MQLNEQTKKAIEAVLGKSIDKVSKEELLNALAGTTAKAEKLEAEKLEAQKEARQRAMAKELKEASQEALGNVKDRIKKSWGKTDPWGRIAAHIAFNTLTISPGEISNQVGNAPIALGTAHGNGLQENRLLQESVVVFNELKLIKLDDLIAHRGKPPFDYEKVKAGCWPLPEMGEGPDREKVWKKLFSKNDKQNGK